MSRLASRIALTMYARSRSRSSGQTPTDRARQTAPLPTDLDLVEHDQEVQVAIRAFVTASDRAQQDPSSDQSPSCSPAVIARELLSEDELDAWTRPTRRLPSVRFARSEARRDLGV